MRIYEQRVHRVPYFGTLIAVAIFFPNREDMPNAFAFMERKELYLSPANQEKKTSMHARTHLFVVI